MAHQRKPAWQAALRVLCLLMQQPVIAITDSPKGDLVMVKTKKEQLGSLFFWEKRGKWVADVTVGFDECVLQYKSEPLL